MNLEKELAELQDALATTDFHVAVENRSKDLLYLIIKQLARVRIKMDGNKNHKRPHLHIDYGKQYHAASFAIDTGERLAGSLDARYDKEIYGWISKHRPKLLQAWALVQSGKDVESIAGELREQ